MCVLGAMLPIASNGRSNVPNRMGVCGKIPINVRYRVYRRQSDRLSRGLKRGPLTVFHHTVHDDRSRPLQLVVYVSF